MIGRLSGTVVEKHTGMLIIDVGGVGYLVRVTPDTAADAPLDDTATLLTHLIVREDALDLYGFTAQADVDLFAQLIGVSGVGPKSALSILSITDARTLSQAIAAGDTSYLTQVSGIGKKVADKIVLELKDKLAEQADTTESTYSHDSDTLDALAALGYSNKEAREALKQIPEETDGTNERIREALKVLGK